MAIFHQTGQAASITESRRSLDLFTNRTEDTRRFADYLHDKPARETILWFHGDGGNGKSLLLWHLQDRYAKRFPEERWKTIRALDDDAFRRAFQAEEGLEPVPMVTLNFGAQPTDEERPQAHL